MAKNASEISSRTNGSLRSTIKSNNDKRQLRTKSDSQQKLVIFDFDDVNSLLQQHGTISLSNDVDFDNLYSYYGSLAVPDNDLPVKLINSAKVSSEMKTVHESDVLEDSLYDHFHKKMKKEEKVMTNEDKTRVMMEIDNLNDKRSLLTQYDWTRHLATITRIKNYMNIEELELKKELTIAEIRRLNQKHDNWKKRVDAFLADVKAYEKSRLAINDLEYEYDLPMAKLRDIRKKERIKKYGPVIKLNLNNGYCIVMDPVLPPQVIETSKKKKTKRRSTVIHKEEPDTITSSRENVKQIFRTLHDLSQKKEPGFQFPLSLKRSAVSTRKEREDFRVT